MEIEKKLSEMAYIQTKMIDIIRDELGESVALWVETMPDEGKKKLARAIKSGWRFHGICDDKMILLAKAKFSEKIYQLEIYKDGKFEKFTL